MELQQRFHTTNEMNRQLTEWKKIFIDMSDKGSISKIYKELIQLNVLEKSDLKWRTQIFFTKKTYRLSADK